MDKGPSGLTTDKVHQCKFCEKVCTSESGLTNHINNIHQERQNIFTCCYCGRKFNVFNTYIDHIGTHPKKEYKCHVCSEQFQDARLLSLHNPTHLIQCPFCSRTFKDLKQLENHVNKAHGKALAEENKKCSYCDAAFESIRELQDHIEIHKYFSCEICFAGFVSDVILIEHKLQDHPEGPPPAPQPQATPSEPVPSTSGVTSQAEEQAPIIQVPEPDPFQEKLDTTIGLVNPDRDHQVQCVECGRFLSSRKMRKKHMMCYHPMSCYQCPFHPTFIFYTMDDLVLHCKQNHEICNICPSTMCPNKAALEEHFRKVHPASPPPKEQPAATSSPIPADEPEFEQVEPTEESKAKTKPQPTVASSPVQEQPDPPTPAIQANVRPVRDKTGKFTCNYCLKRFGTVADFRLHLNVHRKVSCKFCYRKFLNTSSMEDHVQKSHQDSKVPQYHCKLGKCKLCFQTLKERINHLRRDHRSLFRYRCKKCRDCFITVEELFSHFKVHNEQHLPFAGKWSCSRCAEIFDNLAQLMEHTRIHTENSYECDECNWRFSSVSELTLHGREFHDTREHACHWCPRYFIRPDLLLQHGNNDHNCECSRCNDVFPSADQLHAHQMVRHGKPITEEDERREQMKEAQEKREKKREQCHKREEIARTPATFSCTECVNFFSKQKDLDDHITKYHTFVCPLCQEVTKSLPELDYHMDMKHDDTPKKLPAKYPEDEQKVREWKQKAMVEDQERALEHWRVVKDMASKENWDEYWGAWAAQKSLDKEKERKRRGKKRKYATKEEAEAATGDDKDEDPDYVKSEEGSTDDPLYEPSKKELKRADKEGDK